MSPFQTNAQPPRVVRVIIIVSLIILSTTFVGNARADDVTLAWDENLEPGVEIEGYRVYFGTDGVTFPNEGCEVGGTSCTVSSLSPGQTYYFVATAYNNDGESGYSVPPVTFTVPAGVSTYTIESSTGPNGSISPSGSIPVSGGGNQSFSISPNSGYHVDDVVIDGNSVGTVSSYSFNNVSAAHTITAYFAADNNSYEITASAGNGGSISPSGSVPVDHGGSQVFTITASSGYQIIDVSVDGVSQGAASSYTFNNVFSNYTIAASFAPIPASYTITASAGSNGDISPTGTLSVTQGANQSFSFSPASGYQVADVLVNNSSMGAISSYTFSNVRDNQTISVSFSIIAPNLTPYPPDLLMPEDDVDAIAMTPMLEIAGFSDPDPGDIHGGTRWQIASDDRFNNLIIDIVCDTQTANSYLLSLQVPQGTLMEQQTYYWRAMVRDARSNNSKWSQWSHSRFFTTVAEVNEDLNTNGVPDEFEPLSSDLDNNGQNDNDQPLMRVMSMNAGEGFLGIKAVEGVSAINRFTQIDPSSIFDFPRPVLPYGLMSLNVNLEQIGGTVRFELYVPETPDEGARWYKYDPLNGWYEFPVQVISGKYILEIVDGGFGDADGVANGIIVDPIGVSDTTAVNEITGIDTGGSENTLDKLINACFIGSTMKQTSVSAASGETQEQHFAARFILCGILIFGLAGILIRLADNGVATNRR